LTTAEAESLNSVNSKDQRIATPNQIITAGQTNVWIHLPLCQEKKRSSENSASITSSLLPMPLNTVRHCYKSSPLQPSIAGCKAHGIKIQTQELIATVGPFTKCSKATKTTTACKREQSTLHYLVLESEPKARCHL